MKRFDYGLVKQIRNAFVNGKGSIRIGYELNNKVEDYNPLFAIIEGELFRKGYKIEIDVENLKGFDTESRSKLMWRLMILEDLLTEMKRKRQVLTIDSIKNNIKDSVLHLYDMLYKGLEEYNKNYYKFGRGAKTTDKFHVSFYRPDPSGMSASSLYRTKTKSSTSIELVTTDPEYKKKLASVVYYMVKNMFTIVIKQGGSGTAINAFYANIFRILDEDYIKQNFYDTEIGGTIIYKHIQELIDKGEDITQWIDSEFFSDLKDDYWDEGKGAFTLENAYSIWLFSDSDKFDEVFAKLFFDAATRIVNILN